jgi:16S rRNA processing protein RimM
LTDDKSADEERPPVTVGRIVTPHGVRGELKVESLTDFPERFRRGSRLWLDGVEFSVELGRVLGRHVILKLEGIDDRNAAEAIRGRELTVPDVAELTEEGVYYQHDIVGLRVEDEAGSELGRVVDVLLTGSNDVYVVQGERGELLLPALDDVVKQIDIATGRIVVDLPGGLEFQAKAPPRQKAPPRARRRKPKPASGEAAG